MRQPATHHAGVVRGVTLLAILPALTLSLALSSPAAASQVGGAPSGASRIVRTLDFVEAPVADVVKAISIQGQANVVVTPGVKGTVTLRLSNVTLDEALQRVAASVGADVLRIGNTYYLGLNTELRTLVARNGQTATYAARNLTPPQIQKLLESSFPYLQVTPLGEPSKVVTLAGRPEDVQAALRLAAEQDVQPFVQPTTVTRIRQAYAAKTVQPAELAQALRAAYGNQLNVTVTPSGVVVEGPETLVKEAATLLGTLDAAEVVQRQRKVIRAYTLKYLHPLQAATSIQPLFPMATGGATLDNTLTIVAGPEPYAPTPAQFTPLSLEAAQAFQQQGFQNTAQGGGGGGGGGGGAGGSQQIQSDQSGRVRGIGMRARQVLMAGPADYVEQATQVLTELDVAPPQVLIEARMVDVSPEFTQDLGLDFNLGLSRITFREQLVDGLSAGPFARTAFGFEAILRAAETDRRAKILATPNIAVIDGEEATIFIGDILRFERLTGVAETGRETFTIETVPVGVALLVRPRVNTDGKITLRVHPVVSSLRGFAGQRGDIPQTQSRETESTIRVSDGETIAISGLIQDSDIRTIRKIPILGDLPIIGYIFRSKSVTRNRSEVNVFLTVKIIND